VALFSRGLVWGSVAMSDLVLVSVSVLALSVSAWGSRYMGFGTGFGVAFSRVGFGVVFDVGFVTGFDRFQRSRFLCGF
jgi:hypothetical protein